VKERKVFPAGMPLPPLSARDAAILAIENQAAAQRTATAQGERDKARARVAKFHNPTGRKGRPAKKLEPVREHIRELVEQYPRDAEPKRSARWIFDNVADTKKLNDMAFATFQTHFNKARGS
jgi:hypothetical protein